MSVEFFIHYYLVIATGIFFGLLISVGGKGWAFLQAFIAGMLWPITVCFAIKFWWDTRSL